MFIIFYYFLVREGPKRAWEVFKRLPGGRGFVLTKYGPVASHGDPIQPNNYGFLEFANSVVMLSSSENDDVAKINQWGARKMIM